MQLYYSYTNEAFILGKKDKLLSRFLSKPKDLTWNEYVKVFASFGFQLHNGDGSKRRFVNENKLVFMIHEPHPANIMKPYTIKQAIDFFEQHGLLPLSEHDDE